MFTQRQALSVTELVRYLRTILEEDEGLFSVWVRGEISNFHHHVRGHMYFTLKDESSRIRAVMFAGNNRRLRFMPVTATRYWPGVMCPCMSGTGRFSCMCWKCSPTASGNSTWLFSD